ncbi:hypothetical protein AGMMS4956_00880 [Bacteroidia bacterium]|nr:hypothetical protein AGMMS4956_00880 [Bacteroidia bacterium]
MKKVFFCLSSAALLFSVGCQSLKLADIEPTANKNPRLLPPVEVRLDVATFGTVYDLQSTHQVQKGNATHQVTANTPLYRDLVTIAQKDIRNNVSEKYGEPKGTIKYKLITGETCRTGTPLLVFDWLTLRIINLLAVPSNFITSKMQVRADVYDAKGNLVGEYTSAYNKSATTVALYYGYSYKNAAHKATLATYKLCLDDIKKQITGDYERLFKALDPTGEVPTSPELALSPVVEPTAPAATAPKTNPSSIKDAPKATEASNAAVSW